MGTIRATVDTAKLKGLFGKTLDVTTNDPDNERFQLALRARILAGIVLLPDERLYIHDRSPGATTVRRIVRRDPAATGELRLSDVAVDVDWLRVDARRLDAPLPPSREIPDGGRPGDWLLELRVDGAPAYGRSKAELSFATGLRRQPRAGYGVVVQLRPPFNLSAREIVLRDGAPTTLLVSMRPELVGQTVDVVTRPTTIAARLEPSGERRFKVHVDWTGAAGAPLPDDAAVDVSVGDTVMTVPVRRPGG